MYTSALFLVIVHDPMSWPMLHWPLCYLDYLGCLLLWTCCCVHCTLRLLHQWVLLFHCHLNLGDLECDLPCMNLCPGFHTWTCSRIALYMIIPPLEYTMLSWPCNCSFEILEFKLRLFALLDHLHICCVHDSCLCTFMCIHAWCYDLHH